MNEKKETIMQDITRPAGPAIALDGEAKALAPRESKTFAFAPTTLAEAMEYARLIAQSELCPAQYRGKPGDVLVAVQMGGEFGISPMAAIQNIAVINGRPTMWGDLVLALVQRSGLLEAMEEREAASALSSKEGSCTVTRRGQEPITRTFSLADAERAGLVRRSGPSGPWTTYPGRMLQMRARSWALRDAFADVLKGLQVREEVEDYPPAPEPIRMPERASAVREIVEDFLRPEERPQARRQEPAGEARGTGGPPPAAPEGNSYRGFLARVEEKSGETRGRAWMLYRLIPTEEGAAEIGTFSETIAATAREAISCGDPVEITYEATPKGGRKATGIRVLEIPADGE